MGALYTPSLHMYIRMVKWDSFGLSDFALGDNNKVEPDVKSLYGSFF